jgi:predicted O-methyltransferase YrrM
MMLMIKINTGILSRSGNVFSKPQKMYSKFQLGFKYLYYYLTASNGKGHGIHSPFIFYFISKILNDKHPYPEYDTVENLRQKLLKDQTLLSIEDFGAGSSINKSNRRTVASIAKNVAKQKKYGQLLFRMTREYKPKTVLELGTSLGITTSYLAMANPDTNVTSIEGSKEVAAIAEENFRILNLQKVELIKRNFDDSLSSVIDYLSSIDFVFIDGNHRREPTERYFRQLLAKANNDSIFIFDDIHWSKEMEEAWSIIKSHEAVRCSVDLFFIGIIFFKQEFKETQHFVIRF